MNELAPLGDIATVNQGYTFKPKYQGMKGEKWPYIKVADVGSTANSKYLNTYLNSVSDAVIKEMKAQPFEAGSIVFPRVGAALRNNNKRILLRKCLVDDNVLVVTVKNPNYCYSEYLYYWFISKDLATFCNDGLVPVINSSNLKKQKVQLPPLPEQKAIAELISIWDLTIEKMEGLIRAKEKQHKGQIQLIIGKQRNDLVGESLVPLSEIFEEVIRKVGEKNLIPFSISAGVGFVSQSEKWGKDISGAQYENYTHLKAGEFSYNKGNSKRYKQGCIYLLKEGEVCVPNVFISFKPKDLKKIIPEFYEHYFIADFLAKELKQYITSGARSDGLLNIAKSDFFKVLVPCPPLETQKKIAEFLTASFQEINLLRNLLQRYKLQKRGLMQKLLTGEWRVKP